MRKIYVIIFLLLATCIFAKDWFPKNTDVLIKETYDKIQNQTIKIEVYMKFGADQDWSSESSYMRVLEVDDKGKSGKEIGRIEYPDMIPLKLMKVRTTIKDEVVYATILEGNRGRCYVTRITLKGIIELMHEIGMGFLGEEVLDVDNDGNDEIILHRTPVSLQEKDDMKEKYAKEIYKYQNGIFEKIREIKSFEDFMIKNP